MSRTLFIVLGLGGALAFVAYSFWVGQGQIPELERRCPYGYQMVAGKSYCVDQKGNPILDDFRDGKK